jgi:hypothetical protein
MSRVPLEIEVEIGPVVPLETEVRDSSRDSGSCDLPSCKEIEDRWDPTLILMGMRTGRPASLRGSGTKIRYAQD